MTTDPRTVCVELPGQAVIDVRGADAAAFLQGQLSNDLAAAGAGRAVLAGYCSPKGRLLALPLVLTLADGGLRLVVPAELVEGLLARLGMFVLRADVRFVVRDDLVCLGLTVAESATGEPLGHGVAALPPAAPEGVLDVLGGGAGADTAQILRWHDVPGARRYLLVVARDAVSGTLADGAATWRLGDVAAGIPRVLDATRERFVPQMVNLQRVDGLSFRKGCYPGQEIVARMQYLGKLKRHMRRFRVAEPAGAIGPGSAVAAGDDADGGTVVDAVATPEGVELLAVVRIEADPDALSVGGAPLEPRPLPYALGDDAPTAAPAGRA